jgi:hypothetical protein
VDQHGNRTGLENPRKTGQPKSAKPWSGRRESNPHEKLGKLCVLFAKQRLDYKTTDFAV